MGIDTDDNEVESEVDFWGRAEVLLLANKDVRSTQGGTIAARRPADTGTLVLVDSGGAGGSGGGGDDDDVVDGDTRPTGETVPSLMMPLALYYLVYIQMKGNTYAESTLDSITDY